MGWGGKETMEDNKNTTIDNQENNQSQGGGDAGGKGAEDKKPMSFDDFLKQPGMQAEFDKRLGKGIDTAVAKESSRLKTVYDQQLDEQARMAKMTDVERTAYLDNKRNAELAQREADITRRELTAAAKDKLVSKGLPIELSDILVYTDQDACDKSLDKVEAAFTAAVKAAVDEKLKGNKPPKDASSEGDGDKTAAEKLREQAARIAGVKL